MTNKEAEIWIFSYYLKGAELNVILPEGSIIKNITNGEIYLDNSEFAIYNKDKIEVRYIIRDVAKSNFMFIMTLLIPLFIIILIILYFINKNKSKNKGKAKERKKQFKKLNKKQKFEIIKQTLNDREKIIIDKLREIGKIKHSRLQKLLEIPKASFSRHIKELEKKSLIKREGEGKNKVLSLR